MSMFACARRMNAASCMVFAVALLAAGCGAIQTRAALGNDGVRPEGPSWISRPSGVLKVAFRKDLSIDARKPVEAFETGSAAVDPKHGRVFVGSSNHGLYALRGSDGGTIWRFETEAAVQSEPVYDASADAVYFGSHDGALYAVHAHNGVAMYRYPTIAEVTRAPILYGNTLVFVNGADTLYAINKMTGAKLWQAGKPPAGGMGLAGHSGPATDGKSVFVGHSDGTLAAYRLDTGAETWAPVELAQESETYRDIGQHTDTDTTPMVFESAGNTMVIAGNSMTGVVALDAATGSRIWTNSDCKGAVAIALWHEPAHMVAASVQSANIGEKQDRVPVSERNVVYITTMTGIWALEASTGHELWRAPVPEGGVSRIAFGRGALVLGTARNGLYLLSPTTGKPIDGIDMATGFSSTPTVYAGRIFAMSNAGALWAVDIDAPGATAGSEKLAGGLW